MGFALIDKATKKIIGWNRHDSFPGIDTTQQVVVQSDAPPDDDQVWDDATGLRSMTLAEQQADTTVQTQAMNVRIQDRIAAAVENRDEVVILVLSVLDVIADLQGVTRTAALNLVLARQTEILS